MSNKTYSNIFEPPQNLFGQICVASALSADEAFIENALSIFTKSDCQGRAFDRCYSLFLMLNQGHKLLDKSISGLCQLEPSSQEVWSRIAVQHAKVAIMQFGSSRMRKDYICDDDTIWRLVVCTGNWTEESAKNQIEMVWSVDVNYSESDGKDAADLLLAARFLKNLKKFYSCSDLFWKRARLMLDAIEERYSFVEIDNSRFMSSLPDFDEEGTFDTKGVPLYDSIIKKFKGRCAKYNYLIAGSGFYEQSRDVSKPKILKKLESKLVEMDVTKSCRKHLVVNSENAGQVATWANRDWDVYRPYDYSEKNRKLHAKYIFLGKNFNGKVKKGVMYVGSGNLSIMGLLSAYGVIEKKAGRGNIEAGIVFETSGYLPEDEAELNKALACCCDDEIEFGDALVIGENSDEPKPTFIPPSPLYAIRRLEGNEEFKLLWNDSTVETAESHSLEINGNTEVIPANMNVVLKWSTWGLHGDDLPQWIRVVIDGNPYQVPVISDDGLLIEAKRTLKDPAEWIDFLDNFPKNADSKDAGDDEGPDDDDPDGSPTAVGSNEKNEVKHFPYQNAMRIVEGLANLNNRYFPKDGSKANCQGFLEDWIFQIDNSVKCLPEEFRIQMKNIGINFLSVLKNEDGFAPTLVPELRSQWNEFIDKWAEDWELPKDNCIWKA